MIYLFNVQQNLTKTELLEIVQLFRLGGVSVLIGLTKKIKIVGNLINNLFFLKII